MEAQIRFLIRLGYVREELEVLTEGAIAKLFSMEKGLSSLDLEIDHDEVISNEEALQLVA